MSPFLLSLSCSSCHRVAGWDMMGLDMDFCPLPGSCHSSNSHQLDFQLPPFTWSPRPVPRQALLPSPSLSVHILAPIQGSTQGPTVPGGVSPHSGFSPASLLIILLSTCYHDSYPSCSCDSPGEYFKKNKKNIGLDQTDLIRISVGELQASVVF